jgi:hypothetical protein
VVTLDKRLLKVISLGAGNVSDKPGLVAVGYYKERSDAELLEQGFRVSFGDPLEIIESR